jgi:hypothetical protein
MRAFSMPGSTANQEDDARIRMIGRQGQEVVSIAGDQKQFVFASVTKYIDVIRLDRQHLTEFNYLMTFLSQHPRNLGWYIMINEKPHRPGLIWRATKVSISAR